MSNIHSVKFVDKVLLTEDLLGKGVIVVDTNMQGVWETGILKSMKSSFPRIYSQYMNICLNHSHRYIPGDAIMFEEAGYKVVLLITKNRRKTPKEITLMNLEKAIMNMMVLVPSDVYLYSPVLGREDKCFVDCLKVIRKLIVPELRNWFIYRKT